MSHTATQQQRAQLTPIVNNLLDRIVLHILYSRVSNEERKKFLLSENDKNINELKQSVRRIKHFKDWNDKRIPIIINVYYQPYERKTRVLLEKWKICIEENNKNEIPQPSFVYLASFKTLLRSVISTLRILPTFRFLYESQLENVGKPAFSIEYNTNFENDLAFNNCGTRTYKFTDVCWLNRKTSVFVCYRTNCNNVLDNENNENNEKIQTRPVIIDNYNPNESNSSQNQSPKFSKPIRIPKRNDNTNIIDNNPLEQKQNSVPFKESPPTKQDKWKTFESLFLGSTIIPSDNPNNVDTISKSKSKSKLSWSGLKSSNPSVYSDSKSNISLSVSPFKEAAPIHKNNFNPIIAQNTELPLEQSFLIPNNDIKDDNTPCEELTFVDSLTFASDEDEICELIHSCISAASSSQDEANRLSTSSLSGSYFGSTSISDIIEDLELFTTSI